MKNVILRWYAAAGLAILLLPGCSTAQPTAAKPTPNEESICNRLTIDWRPPASNSWDSSFVASLPKEAAAKLSQEDLAAALFCQYLEHANTPLASPSQAITAYRVQEVSITPNPPDDPTLALVAKINFSVQPEDILTTGWFTGNGVEAGNWIIAKVQFIGIKEEDETYSMVLLGTAP